MTQRPAIVDPVARIETTPRGAVGGHHSPRSCHLCDESCQAGAELRVHSKEMHLDSTEATGSGDEIETKKKPFLQIVQDWVLTNNAGNEPLPKATSTTESTTKESTKASIEEDIEQHDQDRPHGQSPPLEDRFKENLETEPEMLLKPDTRPISHEQLVLEIKGIYARLAIVEGKCIDVDERQLAAAQEKDPLGRVNLKTEQWQSLIALHKQLLYEHHDFLLVCQHPSGSPALSELATKYSMPARLWRHGIHALLEVLRYRLPESLEYMLAFIYIAYPMIALLYETASKFQDIWIECLGRIILVSEKRTNWLTVVQGDLARYRMAIQDDKLKDREVWSSTSRFWYEKAADKSPNNGRLYHHLAILARPCTLEQLSLYARSLTCIAPFEKTRESIMTLFNPVLDIVRPSSWETSFIRAHAILFTGQTQDRDDKFDAIVDKLVRDDLSGAKAATRFRELGAFAAISNIAALFEYGTPKPGVKARLRLAYELAQKVKDTESEFGPCNPNELEHPFATEENEDVFATEGNITRPSRLASKTLKIWLNRGTDGATHPLVHIYLVFIRSLIIAQEAWRSFEKDITWRTVERDIPWYAICLFLNTVAGELHSTSRFFAEDFPQSSEENGDKEKPRPLPEDFILRGQIYSQWYFPSTWFTNTMVDDDERTLELPSMVQPRTERILWLGYRIASANRWIRFDVVTRSFEITDYVINKLNVQAKAVTVSADFDTIMMDACTTNETPRTPAFGHQPELSSQSSSIF